MNKEEMIANLRTAKDIMHDAEISGIQSLNHFDGAKAYINKVINGINEQTSDKLLDVLKRYESWEAKLIEDVDSWENGYPSITGQLFDEFLEIQELRNNALSSYKR